MNTFRNYLVTLSNKHLPQKTINSCLGVTIHAGGPHPHSSGEQLEAAQHDWHLEGCKAFRQRSAQGRGDFYGPNMVDEMVDEMGYEMVDGMDDEMVEVVKK